jgi:hypothetical protein
MKNPTLTEIRKAVEASGGEFKKENFYLNMRHAYIVNGKIMSHHELKAAYKMGILL